MKLIIIGAGEVGYHTALRLSREGHNVVVVDRDPLAVRKVDEKMDVQTLLGPGSSPLLLRQAGVVGSDLVVAVTDSDEVNLQACRFAKLLAPNATRIARIRSADYLDFIEEMGVETLDVDTVINPERELAAQILKFISVPAASSVADFAESRVKLLGLKVPATSPLAGKNLSQWNRGAKVSFLVAAIERGGQIIIPRGDTRMLSGDLAYVVAQEDALKQVIAHFGLRSGPVKNLVIVGGGEIGSLVAASARRQGIKVRIIEKNEKRCRMLVDRIDGVMILHGEGSDLSLLEEENIGATDVFAAVTDDEEDNVLIALLGKKMGAKRTIARVAHMGYVPLASSLGLDLVVSPRFAAVGAILRHLRRGKVLSVASLTDEEAEVIEVQALETSGLVGKPLSKVKMPDGAIVAAVVTGGKVEIPSGETVVQPGDHLVIFLLRSVLSKVEKLLTVSLEFF